MFRSAQQDAALSDTQDTLAQPHPDDTRPKNALPTPLSPPNRLLGSHPSQCLCHAAEKALALLVRVHVCARVVHAQGVR